MSNQFSLLKVLSVSSEHPVGGDPSREKSTSEIPFLEIDFEATRMRINMIVSHGLRLGLY
jgi:hypothetical protein